ncbi:MAG: CoA-binding protein [Polyangia bacterium]
MTDLETIERFLEGKRIALVGVSSHPEDFSRMLFRELRDRGYDMVPVRPGVTSVEDVPAYPRVQDVPGALDGAILMTPPEVTRQVVRDCSEAHVPRVWMHRAAGRGAVSAEGVAFCREHGMEVIAGECPFMFLPNAGAVHSTHAAWRRAIGTYPRTARNRRPHYGVLFLSGALAWLLCAAAMAFFLVKLPLSWALALNALLVLAVFGATSALYFKRSGSTSPLTTAGFFTGLAGILNLGVLFGLVERSLPGLEPLALALLPYQTILRSFTATWLPLLLIFSVTMAMGVLLDPQRRSRRAGPRP